VHKALEKLPADRFAAAGEFAEALADPGLMAAAGVTPAAARPAALRLGVPLPWALVTAAAAVIALWGWLRPVPDAGPAVYDVALPDSAPIAFSAFNLPSLAVAPDARFAVYVAQRDTTTELWYRSLVNSEVRRIPGTDGAYAPMVSPDGGSVAFVAGNQLKTVRVSGGVPTSLAVVSEPSGGEWLANGRILVADQEARRLRWLDPEAGEVAAVEPLWTPAGDRILVVVASAGGDSAFTLMGAPTAAHLPDTLLHGLLWAPFTYRSDSVVVGWEPVALQALRVNLSTDPPDIDTLASGVYFPTLSPDGRWLLYQAIATGQLFLQSYPSGQRRFQVSNVGWEAQWLGTSELVYWAGTTWFRVSVTGSGDRPAGRPRVWFSDPRFANTPGQSHEVTPDGGVIYLQGPAQAVGSYLRVVPNWVTRVKRAVDEAGR
jgi:hypothetical protein